MNRRRFFALIGAAIAGKKLAPACPAVPPHLRVSDAVMSLPSGGAGLFNPSNTAWLFNPAEIPIRRFDIPIHFVGEPHRTTYQ